MSYDLHLFRVPPGADPLEAAHAAYEGDEESAPVEPEPGWRERMQGLAAAISAADPTLAARRFDEGREERIELDAPEDGSGLQTLLFPDAAYLQLPYWHDGADARLAWEQAWRVLQAAEREGGLRTYDPQLDRVLALETDRDAVLAEYARGVREARKISEAAIPSRRPWWKFWG